MELKSLKSWPLLWQNNFFSTLTRNTNVTHERIACHVAASVPAFVAAFLRRTRNDEHVLSSWWAHRRALAGFTTTARQRTGKQLRAAAATAAVFCVHRARPLASAPRWTPLAGPCLLRAAAVPRWKRARCAGVASLGSGHAFSATLTTVLLLPVAAHPQGLTPGRIPGLTKEVWNAGLGRFLSPQCRFRFFPSG